MKKKFEFLFLLVSLQVLFTLTIITCIDIEKTPPNAPNEFTTFPRTKSELAAYQQYIVNLTKKSWNSFATIQKGHLIMWGDNEDLLNSLPTLMIMGLKEEVALVRDWIASEYFKPDRDLAHLVRPLLACHVLSNDQLYLDRALEMIKHYDMLNTKHLSYDANFASIYWNTIALAYHYLTAITEDNRYDNYTAALGNYIESIPEEWNNIGNEAFIKFDQTSNKDFTKAGLYLMKADTFGQTSADQLYANLDLILSDTDWHLNTTDDSAKLLYLTLENMRYKDYFYSSNCKFASVFALAAGTASTALANNSSFQVFQKVLKYWEVAKGLERTCYTIANRHKTKLPVLVAPLDGHTGRSQIYRLTAEMPEMYYVFWQLTGDEIYRKKAWQFMQSLYQYSYYEGDKAFYRVYSVTGGKEWMGTGSQHIFSDTLSYLYLIFSDKDTFPLDRYVFDSKGSPFPIYQKKKCTLTKA